MALFSLWTSESTAQEYFPQVLSLPQIQTIQTVSASLKTLMVRTCINNSNLRGKMIDQRANGFNIVINPESATL